MEVIQTEKQKALNHIPTKLEVLREINKREGIKQNKKLKEEYKRLEKGFKGEQELVKYLEEFGADYWKILRDVWLDYFGEFEIDLLLITGAGLYIFEVKNYTGKLELKNGQCYMANGSIGHNPFSQAQKSLVNLKGIFKNKLNPSKIQGILTFIGENNSVHIHDQLSGIKIITRNELMNEIRKIKQEEREYLGYPLDVESVLSILNVYDIGSPTKEKEIPEEAKANLHTGICCSHCGNFELDTRKSYISCPCGMHESREEAIVRTICEYGIIHHNKNLTTTEVTEFFGEDISRSTAIRYLNKYFKRVGNYKSTIFVNKQKPLEAIFDEIELNTSKYFKIR